MQFSERILHLLLFFLQCPWLLSVTQAAFHNTVEKNSCSECRRSLVVLKQTKVILKHGLKSTKWSACSPLLLTLLCGKGKLCIVEVRHSSSLPPQIEECVFSLHWSHLLDILLKEKLQSVPCDLSAHLACIHAVKYEKSSVWIPSTWFGELVEVVYFFCQ